MDRQMIDRRVNPRPLLDTNIVPQKSFSQIEKLRDEISRILRSYGLSVKMTDVKHSNTYIGVSFRLIGDGNLFTDSATIAIRQSQTMIQNNTGRQTSIVVVHHEGTVWIEAD